MVMAGDTNCLVPMTMTRISYFCIMRLGVTEFS